jgi:hypothetical protein
MGNMITVTSCGQVLTSDGYIVPDGVSSRLDLAAAAYAGYHNLPAEGLSLFRAVEGIRCLPGWHAGYIGPGGILPPGAIRVGQIRIHHGDPEFPLFLARD